MRNIRTAETEKLLEGVSHDGNIAHTNEMAIFCENIGVDFWEAPWAANSRYVIFISQSSCRGTSISVYPQFIIYSARNYRKKVSASFRNFKKTFGKKLILNS